MSNMKALNIPERLRRAWNLIIGRESAQPNRTTTAVIGAWGERQAELHLKKAGFRILHRRLRIGRRDEIDIVARDGEILAFIEVKTRATEDYGRPFSAVDRGKRRALSRAAVRYLRAIKKPSALFRFDVVEVVGSPGELPRDVRHIRNAFAPDKRYRSG